VAFLHQALQPQIVALLGHGNELKSPAARLQGFTHRIDAVDQVHLSSL